MVTTYTTRSVLILAVFPIRIGLDADPPAIYLNADMDFSIAL